MLPHHDSQVTALRVCISHLGLFGKAQSGVGNAGDVHSALIAKRVEDVVSPDSLLPSLLDPAGDNMSMSV